VNLGFPALLACLALASCGGGGSGGDPHYAIAGMLGIPSSTVIGANLVFVRATVDGNASIAAGDPGILVDSGSPVVLIDPSHYGLPSPAAAADIQTQVDLGLLKDDSPVVTILQVPALQLSAAMMDTTGFGGVLGGDVMRAFSVQLDYAAPMATGFCVGCTSGARDDVESPGASIPFGLGGGGTGPVGLSAKVESTVTLPATRVLVTVDIEGTSYPFMLDTGASEVTVRTSVFDALTADGRSQLQGFPITTVTGDSSASVTRAAAITVGGETVADVPIMTMPGDDLLDHISHELESSGGQQIDGLLGGSFLRNFLVTIDYPDRHLHLQQYGVQTWRDEFKRAGIDLVQTPPGAQHWYAVGVVYPGTDAAAKGLRFGDQVWSIDGTSLDGLDPISADSLLDGTVGTTKTLVLAASDTATPVTLSVLVDDLIPGP
jgi:hypothetical protein